jgi:NAD(P)-dependent dehydrogenase (short-subunit alcohol dehydrogenase family)
VLTLIGLNQELKLEHGAPKILTTSIHPHWVRTPLIKSWEKGLHAANAPINEPQVVADAVIRQIVDATGGQVFLPSSVSDSVILRALPNWLQEVIRANVSSVVLNGMKA